MYHEQPQCLFMHKNGNGNCGILVYCYMSLVECFVVEFTCSDIMLSLYQRQFDRLALIHTYLVVDGLYCFSGLRYHTLTDKFAILRSHILCDLYINNN